MSWPLVLAGPILRRVEPTRVSAWVALSEPASVSISVWSGLVHAGTGAGLASITVPPLVTSPPAPALRLGAKLHLAVATAELPQPLPPGSLCSYNLVIQADAPADLKSLGLLDDVAGERAHLALGYAPGDLPSFATFPAELPDAVLLHASCRKSSADGPDALAFVDDLVTTARGDALERPHALVLTGDQIYADDVPIALLPALTTAGRELLGVDETLPAGGQPIVVSRTNFPAALRQNLVGTAAAFTSGEARNHLLGFGEYAAMYLFAWSNVAWPELASLSTVQSVLEKAKQDGTFRPGGTWTLLFADAAGEGTSDPLLQRFVEHLFGVDLAFPIAELVRFLTTFDATRLEPRRLAALSEEERAQWARTYGFATALATDGERTSFATFVTRVQGWLGKELEHEAAQTENVRAFHASLPRVRRALANVPTLMIWDDHEVTDDWFLTAEWKARSLASPFGRAVIRNGITAYGVFQGWGNAPASFVDRPGAPDHSDSARAALLREAGKLFAAGASPAPAAAAAAEVDRLLGLDGAVPPPVRWHYAFDAPRFRLVVLDTRTRRDFVGQTAPPALLSDAALEEQLPAAPLPAGLEILVVVSPAPVLGPTLAEEIGQPVAIRGVDFAHALRGGKIDGAQAFDAEAWSSDRVTLEKLLARLAPYGRAVMLSGDVHYACGMALTYWWKGGPAPARFVQFTSSPAKNPWPPQVAAVLDAFALGQRILRAGVPLERLGWRDLLPAPVSVPAGVVAPAPHRAAMRREPVLVPIHGWPSGAAEAREPDFAWRLTLLEDVRPAAERPPRARPLPLSQDLDASRAAASYAEIMLRHQDFVRKNHFGRRILWANNIGRVRFEGTAGERAARHEILSAHPDDAQNVPAAYTVHVAALAPDASETRPRIG